MQSKNIAFFLGITAFIGGFVLLAVELIYPRISAIWFGNILDIWAVDLSMSLLVIAIGYRSGSYFLKYKLSKLFPILYMCYLLVGVFFIFIPHFYSSILNSFLNFPVIIGAIMFAFIFMITTMGILAAASPLLVEIASKSPTQKNATSFIYGISTLGGAAAMLFIGLYFIPYFGIKFSCYLLGILTFLNLILIAFIRKVN